jgi:hypothetical protein
MSQKTNLNTPPYFDDYSETKNFYKILFRPGYPIQTRELTGLQSILQNQIESYGKFQFKQGDLVIPGEVGLNTRLDFVKLSSISEVAVNVNGQIVYKKYDIKDLVGTNLQGVTSGVTALVIESDYATDANADTLYVKYTNSGNSGEESTFRQGETLEVVNGVNTPLLVVGTDGSVSPTSIEVVDPETKISSFLESPAMGYAAGVKVEEGIYFVNGYFVRNEEQLIIVDKYYDKPSAKVGFNIAEEIVTPEQDSSLYDNSRGSSNAAAPGAHRLKLSLKLQKYNYDEVTDKNFIQLISIKSGVIQKLIKQADYSLIENTLARRTYDESGDYVVKEFPLDAREYYQKNGNLGVYSKDALTNLVNGLSETEASNKLSVNVGTGKAYVRGFEIVNNETKYLTINKAKDTITKDNVVLKTKGLSEFKITNVYGTVPLNDEGSDLTSAPTLYLNSVFNDGSIGLNGTEIPSDSKQTVSRRSQGFEVGYGLKTIYIQVTNTVTPLSQLNDSNFTTLLNDLWFIKTRTAGEPSLADFVTPISYSKVIKKEIDENALFLELTVYGSTNLLDLYLKEYEEESSSKIRNVYFTQADALNEDNAFGRIIDYNEIITPIVGVSKPKNISFAKYGKGFNSDTDIVISKGRTSSSVNSVRALNLGLPGTGYSTGTNVPTTTNGNGSGLTVNIIASNGEINNVTVSFGGNGYNIGDTITITGGSGTATATVSAVSGAAYNSTFGLNYFNPVFFTRLLLDSTNSQNNFINQKFSAGKYITGVRSGAYGVIEGSLTQSYSYGNILFVKTLSGTFLPGESITDESGNILRIANENTISHFVVSNRGTGYTSSKINIDGVEFDPSKISVSVEGSSVYKVQIVDRDSVLTQYSQPPIVTITSESEITVPCTVTPVMFRNTVLTYSQENIKSFHCSYGSSNSNKFTADIETNESEFYSTKTITDYTFTGYKGTKYIECTGFDGNAAKDLIQGDLVLFTDVTGVLFKSVVQYATEPNGPRKSRIYLDRCLVNDVNNASVIRIRPLVDNINTSSLVFPTGSKQLKSLIKSIEDSKFKYYARRDFVTTGSSNGGFITFAAQLDFGTQRFVQPTTENFLITVLNKGSSSVVENGDVLYIDPRYISVQSSTESTDGLTAGSITITLPSNFFGNISSNFPKLKLSATIEISKAKPRIKTAVKNKRIVIVSSGDKVIPLRGQDYDTEEVEILSYSDAFNIRYIYEGSSTNPPTVDNDGKLISGTDVTNRFTFDDGQRDTFYDVSRLVLKPGFNAPIGQLVVGFDYFDHSQGDFCTVDSYLHEAGVSAGEIPSFNSTVYGNVSLKDVVDFRPKVDSNTIISGFQDKTILGQASYVNFNGSGGIFASTPASDKNIEYTFTFSETQYLDRIDGIFLDKQGNFIVKEGNSSLTPAKPEIIDDAIALYYIHIPAFTTSYKDVRVIPVDNRRYTMRDIGKLEKRIERLEYYTSLSILEQQTLNMQIKDEIGLDRFKSGFIVDNFETHRVGNISSIDYKCSIDTQQSVLRPSVKEDNFKLQEVYTRSDERINAGYQKTGDVITLPYTNVSLLGNNFATKTINPNSFVVLQYVGDISITPTVDQWFDTGVVPLITDNNTKLFSIFLSKEDKRDAFSAFYNSFIVNWIGSNRTFFNIGSLSEINTEDSSSTVQLASVASSSNISPQNNETAKGVSNKIVNGNAVISSIQYFTRSIPVKFKVTRMKPKTQVYVFMEGINVGRWVNPDIRYTGIAGNSLTTFNSPVITDDNGNASGIILVPSGKPPRENAVWTGDTKTVSYDESAQDLYLTTGAKTIRFTSSSTDENKDVVDTYAEIKYYSSGAIPENPSSIISTLPAYFKANEGIQIVDNTTSNKDKPNPLSQTFKIENFDGGVFVTGLDLFFKKKSSKIPLRVYLTNVDIGKPGKYIIPGTETTLTPETSLKVYASAALSIFIGETVKGKGSGASGPILKVIDKNGNEVLPSTDGEIILSNTQVYTLVLNNHNGISFISGEVLDIPSLTIFNNANAQNLTLTIAKDSGKVVDLKISNVGNNYESAIITIESPQLPGGSTSTGVLSVSNGKIYNAELVLAGNGYTEPPSVVIRGTGTGASGAIVESVIEIDSPAVRMGIAVDTAGVTASTTSTRFAFDHPVYLQNNTEYAMCVETDSTEYELWASRLTETEISTGTSVTTQPLLGSVYKSQNVDNWTEDLFEDIKFTLYRAEFDISRSAELLLTNENLGYERMEIDPVETNSSSNTNATSPLFKNNNSIIKIRHRDNGFETSGKSYVFFKALEAVGGFTAASLNSNLFKVSNVGVDYYNIVGPNRAGSNAVGGGASGLVSFNRKFEKLFAHVNYIQAPNTKIDTFVKTTNVIPVDSNTTNYISYSQGDYEKTFLNEEHFFTNQKIVCSRINEIMNGVTRSLTYKFNLSSTKSYLSPLVDLRVSSAKTSTNRIENSNGQEDRFGKRYQVIKFLPVYTLQLAGLGGVSVLINQTVQGQFSGARGEIIKYENNKIWVKLTSPSTFVSNEEIFLSSQSQVGANLENATVSITSNGITQTTFNFEIGSTIVAFNPSNTNQKYDNAISGKIINWDSLAKELIVENDKKPINNDYTSKITVGSIFARNATLNNQVSDIFRVGDIIYYNDIPTGQEKFVEIGSMSFTNGVDYSSENSSKNSSALAKYTTKEITINSSGTSIDVRLTANLKDINDVKVLYRYKEVSSQSNFDDIEWKYFNVNGNPDIDVLANYTNTASAQFESQSSYQELKYSVANLPEFTSFAIKVVMKTPDPVYVPKIQDLRAVASY